MLREYECFEGHSKIREVTSLEDATLLIDTEFDGLFQLSPNSCQNPKNLTTANSSASITAFCAKRKLLAFAKKNTLSIFDLNSSTLLQSINTDEGDILLLAFVPNSAYIITGTNRARVVKYRFDAPRALSRLCSFSHTLTSQNIKAKSNYVSAFAFYKNYIACSGFGGLIKILQINSLSKKREIQISKVRIDALCFIDEKRLICGSVDGVLYIHSLEKGHTTKIDMPFTHINKILLHPTAHFALVSAESKDVALVDLELEKLSRSKYISCSANIVTMHFHKENLLLLALKSNKLVKITLPSKRDLQSLTLHYSLDKAFTLLDLDPTLSNSEEAKHLESLYKRLYQKSFDAHIEGDSYEVKKFTEIFSEVKSKRGDILSLKRAFSHYRGFKANFIEKKYSLCYAMAEKFPALKCSDEYKKMQESFQESYNSAQKQILLGRKDLAQNSLSPYLSSLSKKPTITLLLQKNRDFLLFLRAIERREYQLMETLLKRHKEFHELANYKSFTLSIKKSLQNIESNLNAVNLDSAIEEIKSIQNAPNIKKELQELYSRYKIIKKLLLAYKENKFKLCYEILDSSNTLDNLELTQLLEKHWSRVISECELYALNGDIPSIKSSLKELIGVKTRLAKIGDLFRLSFYVKIEALLSKQNFITTENLIYSYIDIFNLDSEILSLMKKYEHFSGKKLAITLKHSSEYSRDSWVDFFSSLRQ